MTGTPREHAAGLRQRLDGRRQDPALPGLAGELFAAADAIGGDLQLRAALSDAGQAAQARVGTVQALFGPRLSPLAVETLADVVGQRWSDPTTMVEAIEDLAAQAAFLVAEADGRLDGVEDELFAFSRAVSGSSELQMALTDPAVGAPAKQALVESLLADRAAPQTVQVAGHALANLRGRRADAVLEDLMELAADQRGRGVAEVRVARPLDPDQAQRLAAALSRLQGREIRLNVAVDPTVVGGVSVRVGSEVIDGTLATRIEQARRALVG
ncbi:MAG: F0F1 ATP synthase subunit delta [Candidatus Nanopelagicales bacterium]|jgi:F-type H+-transporting ATPase subunit delta|nr:F0F1 ATP synthase subunit delta [Candidatus Nanopelagicales bacterium]